MDKLIIAYLHVCNNKAIFCYTAVRCTVKVTVRSKTQGHTYFFIPFFV